MLEQVTRMAALDGFDCIYDVNRVSLPVPKPDVSSLDAVADADVLKLLADNKKGMALLNTGFTLTQHMSVLKECAVDGYYEE
jgi:hypothetical protein